jgi:hypothetical protein
MQQGAGIDLDPSHSFRVHASSLDRSICSEASYSLAALHQDLQDCLCLCRIARFRSPSASLSMLRGCSAIETTEIICPDSVRRLTGEVVQGPVCATDDQCHS